MELWTGHSRGHSAVDLLACSRDAERNGGVAEAEADTAEAEAAAGAVQNDRVQQAGAGGPALPLSLSIAAPVQTTCNLMHSRPADQLQGDPLSQCC